MSRLILFVSLILNMVGSERVGIAVRPEEHPIVVAQIAKSAAIQSLIARPSRAMDRTAPPSRGARTANARHPHGLLQRTHKRAVVGSRRHRVHDSHAGFHGEFAGYFDGLFDGRWNEDFAGAFEDHTGNE
eukprot:TRINITY_DN45493_c0_g1_i1.p2 TRINITY_DN45493_c0_g1~~TRINITY_DN45493_c0_g1_i1.p2  ORF type:complete len:130 (+),score=11.93 TRINITY_DN45493_c0_g1_i1:125-514(+)